MGPPSACLLWRLARLDPFHAASSAQRVRSTISNRKQSACSMGAGSAGTFFFCLPTGCENISCWFLGTPLSHLILVGDKPDPEERAVMRSIVTRCLAVLLALSLAAPELLEARVEPTHGFDMFSTQEEIQAGQQA